MPLKFQNLIAVILGYLISSIPIKRNRISKVNIDLCFKDLSQIERFKIYDKNKKAFIKNIDQDEIIKNKDFFLNEILHQSLFEDEKI